MADVFCCLLKSPDGKPARNGKIQGTSVQLLLSKSFCKSASDPSGSYTTVDGRNLAPVAS